MWTTAQKVRDLLGVDIDTADDDILNEFITMAMRTLRKYIQVSVVDGGVYGNLDGINNTFTTQYNFWANTTGDTLISTLDFSVYGWKDTGSDPFKRDELEVSVFDPLRGKVVLVAAPSKDTYKKITVDYSYYTKRIDWELLGDCTAWKAAELWVKREEYLVPETYKFGNKSVTQKRPWQFFELEVRRLIDKLIALPMDKVNYSRMVFRPRGPEGPDVKSTSATDMNQSDVYTPDEEIAEVVDNAES